MSDDDSSFFDTRRAAASLGLSPRTLDGYRASGDGPARHRFGNPNIENKVSCRVDGINDTANR